MPVRALPRLMLSMRHVTDMTAISDDVLRQIPWRVLPYVRNGASRLYLCRHVEAFAERLFARRLARGEPSSIESLVQLAAELDPMIDHPTPAEVAHESDR
jgi:hypothetical protein